MEIPEAVRKAIKGKKVKFLCKYLFDFDATPKQEDLIRRIMYAENLRLLVCAMTRWGKTVCVAIGISLFLLIQYKPKKIAFIGPQKEQADLIRTYMSELILKCDLLLNLAEFDVVGVERLKKEATKTRLTFKNNCEYRIFSAHGDANRLMGFGADVVVKDESCLISREANTKRVLNTPYKSYSKRN